MAPAAAGATKSQQRRERARALNAARGDDLPEFGPPKASDREVMRRRAAEQNRAAKEDYQREQAGKPSTSSPRRQPSSRAARRPVKVRPTNILRGKPTTSGGSPAQEGAGFLLGLVLYALFINYLRAGPAGVRGWIAAKFINKPMGANSSTSSSAKPAPTPAPASRSSSVFPLAYRGAGAEVSA